MGFLKVLGGLSRSNSPSRNTSERRFFDDKAVATFFCHGRADSDATVQMTQAKRRGEDELQQPVVQNIPLAQTETGIESDAHDSDTEDVLSYDEDDSDQELPSLDLRLPEIVTTDYTTELALPLGLGPDTPQAIPLFFSKLPAELRNHVYFYALVPSEAVDISGGERPAVPALLQTCHQIRHEASGIYYANTTFTHHFQIHFWRTLFNGPLFAWLKSIGPEACSQLQHLTLTHRIIDATGQTFSAFDSFVKVTGGVETDCREFMQDLGALGVKVGDVKVESAAEVGRRRRIATAGNDLPWVRALEAAKRC